MDQRSSAVYQLVSSPFARKLTDKSSQEDGKRRRVTRSVGKWSEHDENSFIDDMREHHLNLEKLAADAYTDPASAVGDGCMTPPHQVDVSSSNSGTPKDVSPEMATAEVAKSLGPMCSKDRGVGEHADQTKETRRLSQTSRCLGGQGKVPK